MAPEADLDAFLVVSGLADAGADLLWTPLAGGVSSDIWKVETDARAICVKRALAELKVAAGWSAPTSRNAYEWAWMCEVRRFCPQATAEPLAQDAALGVFAMAYLEPADHPEWRAELTAGHVDAAAAAAVGGRLAVLHAGTAGRADLAGAFDTVALFHALRLEPYFLTTAQRHPDLAPSLRTLVERTSATRLALVHGDVSPKNILLGPQGPVFLDAECAWYGDPAFDPAFCLTDLLLGAIQRPDALDARLESFQALSEAWLAGVDWEPRQDAEARAAALLPAVMLARVDGKSPMDYIRSDDEKNLVRWVTRPMIASAPMRLDTVARTWCAAMRTGRP